MDRLRVGWSKKEEAENVEAFGVSFNLAKEVVLNSSSLKLANLDKDFVFIGPVDDLSKILVVNCTREQGFRKISWARKASQKEESGYFNYLAEGSLP